MIFPLADALFLILLPDCESIFAVICRACADVQRAEFNAASFPAARQTMSTHTNALEPTQPEAPIIEYARSTEAVV